MVEHRRWSTRPVRDDDRLVDAHTVASVLRGIGADKVQVKLTGKVTCCCLLAFWTHPKGRDESPSMVVLEGKYGDPIYTCLACHREGSLLDLLTLIRVKSCGGREDLVQWMDVVEGLRSADAVTKVERLQARSREASALGAPAPSHAKAAEDVVKKISGDGRLFYDHQAIAKADSVEPISEEEYAPYAGKVSRYALDRGLTIETCKAFQLGNDKAMKRLLFPIRNRKGALVAISGRLYATRCLGCGGEWERRCRRCEEPQRFHEKVGGEELTDLLCADSEPWEPQRPECINCELPKPPKYLHNKGFKRNLVLYGEHMLEESKDGRVYIVEGHLDMIRMWQAGYRPVVAMLGSHPGATQIEKLIKNWQKAIVVGDGNKAGREMAIRVKQMVAGRIPVSIIDLDDERDPGNMSDEELTEKLGPPPDLVHAA